MTKGGKHKNYTRDLGFVSSSKTEVLRVPKWMAEEVMDFAQKLDRGESTDSVQNQKSQSHEYPAVEDLRSIVGSWKDRVNSDETPATCQDMVTLLNQINSVIVKL